MKKRILLLVLAALLAFSTQAVDGISPQAKAVAGVAVFAAVLWFTDAVPLFVTSLCIPFLLVLFSGFSSTDAFSPFFDPLIVLLLGGAVIGRALIKYGLDVEILRFFLRITGTRPDRFLLGLMLATAFVSLWISNTATALMMMPVGVAALTLSRLKPGASYGKAVVLGVAYAATIGGLGTLIGTPPNLITAKFLQPAGISIGFLEWSAKAIPLMLVMLFVAWLVLKKMYKTEIERIRTQAVKSRRLDARQKIVLTVFAATVLLWATEAVHGVHNSLVALLPVFAFYVINFLDTDDFSKIGWDMLILVGGGLSLGAAIHASQLDAALSAQLASIVTGQPTVVVFILVSLFTIVFTAFVPNTAGAAIFIPLLIPLAPALGVSTKALALLAGMVISFDFVVPTGTPPNAIAYTTRYARVSDIIKAGVVISLAGALVATAFAMFW